MAKIALDKYLQENKTFKFWTFLLFSVLLLLFSHSVMSISLKPMDCSMPGFSVLHYIPEFAQTHAHCVGDAIQPSHPLSLPSSPKHNLSHIRVFPNESGLCIYQPKYWSFSFSISTSNEFPGLNSFKIDWFYILVVQRTLKCFPQNHNLRTSIIWLSAFFMVNIAHLYMTTGKIIALTIRILLGKGIICFLICYLGMSQLFFQGESTF